jgi:anhydro-N-acetylmuramic acid kinase
MSGTSLDGVDAVLVGFPPPGGPRAVELLATAHRGFEADLRDALLALNEAGFDELHRAALASNQLAREYARSTESVLAAAGVAAGQVVAIGAHGQTVRHRPGEFDGVGYTWQLDPGALLAEQTGIDVVSNFRVRDVAAGGQGAPLVPAFHRHLLRERSVAATQAILNLGGIGNLTICGADGRTTGFDCGPGNVLLDLWAARHLGRPFDHAGRWAASGRVNPVLLQRLMTTPFVQRAPPKSTGRDLFNAGFIDRFIDSAPALAAVDVQATLSEFTAACVVDGLARAGAAGVSRLWVCGGGVQNTDLMARLDRLLPDTIVATTADLGIDPQWVEAAAFAWLAERRLKDETGSLSEVTGARAARVLGVIHRA